MMTMNLSAANPGGRADGNRKQRGFRALTAISYCDTKSLQEVVLVKWRSV
jgi:hypothetical protein